MTARIFNLDDDERFVRASTHEPDESLDRLPGELEILPRTTGFSGAISLPLLPDLIQIYTVSMASGALTIRRGKQFGTIWFDRGSMIHAVCDDLTGEDAVYRLLQWHDGQFSLDSTAKAPFQSITAAWQEVLMEGCRRLDEAAIADAFGRQQEWSAELADGPLHEMLVQIEQGLSGFKAVAILDYADGSLLALRSHTSELDFASAGPLVAEMLRQQSQIMESLGGSSSIAGSLSILGDQVHLLEALPEGRLLYLVVARDGVNLAVVRRVVDRAIGRLA